MLHLAFVLTFFLPFSGAFVVDKIRDPGLSLYMKVEGEKPVVDQRHPILRVATNADGKKPVMDRRQLIQKVVLTAGVTVSLAPGFAWADVSDGDALPKGAAEFSRSLRLKSDLKAVMKRVRENASEIDKKEWDNISKFLRTTYSTGDDMKVVANGIFNSENKARALEDISQLRKYAQAGDIPVSKQDAKGFLLVADKMAGLLDDFFDSLSDIPDEL